MDHSLFESLLKEAKSTVLPDKVNLFPFLGNRVEEIYSCPDNMALLKLTPPLIIPEYMRNYSLLVEKIFARDSKTRLLRELHMYDSIHKLPNIIVKEAILF